VSELAFQHTGLPDQIALAAPGRAPLSYARLEAFLQNFRCTMAAAGFTQGQVAAMVLPGGPELITAFLGVSAIGAGAPLNPSLTEAEFRGQLQRLRARLVLVSEDNSPAALAAGVLGIPVFRVMPDLAGAAGVFTLAPGEAPAPPFEFRTTSAALLLFTSATTGNPKLVPLTWRNLCAMVARDAAALQLNQSDRFLSMMPLFHLHGLSAVLTQLSCGAGVIATPGFHPSAFPEWMERFRPTWISTNPPINRAILSAARAHSDIFRRAGLRFVRTTGSASGPELLGPMESALCVPVLTGYGLTETGGVTRSTAAARKPGSCGRSSGMEVAIMDSEGRLLRAGLEGEIVVRGESVTSGYLDDPEANQVAFRDGWFHTGDLGHLDNEGFLFITGRLKDMINRGGEKIIPQEVEAVLARHPAVVEAAVFPVTHPTLGEDVAAAIVLREGVVVSGMELRRFAAAGLAAFKVPRHILFVERLPRTAIGKPQRKLLAESFHRSPRSAAMGDRQSDR
jgi:acyl-CoA synthetase (AMP-forming)/AMP-acid ligase II